MTIFKQHLYYLPIDDISDIFNCFLISHREEYNYTIK